MSVTGADGMDLIPGPGVDIVHDLNVVPFSISHDTYDKVYVIHALEHTDNVVRIMKELYRISRDGAQIIIKGPHCSCNRTIWIDPTHKRGLSVGTFGDYFSNDSVTNYYIGVSFEVTKVNIKWMHNPSHFLLRILNGLLNYLVNRSNRTQYLWERICANWVGGFEGIEISLTVRIEEPHLHPDSE